MVFAVASMEAQDGIAQIGGIEMGVNFRGEDGFMAQQFLYGF